MRAPVLAIFAGTTAAHAAAEFMRLARDLPERDRGRIGLLLVDTDDPLREPDELWSEFPVRYRPRIDVPARIADFPRLPQGDDPREPHTYLGSRLPLQVGAGAHDIRNDAHVALCLTYQDVRRQMGEAITRITGLHVNDGLPRFVHVNLVAFIGGGTGGGVIADLACLARQLVEASSFESRIDLTCILPAGGSADHSEVRRANAVASLLEVLALSMAGTPERPYRKYVGTRWHEIAGPIAGEVALIGSAGMADRRDIARVAGMHLYQWVHDPGRVDGARDDRNLPAMFGAPCPLEVRFPTGETALAFAQMAAPELLACLAEPRPGPAPARPDESERRNWEAKWRPVARVRLPRLPTQQQYRDLDAQGANALWREIERAERDITARVGDAVARARSDEMARAEYGSRLAAGRQTAHWQALRDEYQVALAFVRQVRVVALDKPGRVNRHELFLVHREHLDGHARNERRRLLEPMLRGLLARVHERLETTRPQGPPAGVNELAAELQRGASSSPAWRGELHPPHLFQRHLLDLDALGRVPGRPSQAVARLYDWSTGVILSPADRGQLAEEVRGRVGANSRPERLVQTVVDVLESRYRTLLESADLLRLLELAAPNESGPLDPRQIADSALVELMRWLNQMMGDLVPVVPGIVGERAASAFRSEVLLSHPAEPGDGEARILRIADEAGVFGRVQWRELRAGPDPHRLQVSYRRHGISLAAIPDLAATKDSAMECYLRSRDTGLPVHTCTALEQLVTKLDLVRLVAGERPAPPPGRPAPSAPRPSSRAGAAAPPSGDVDLVFAVSETAGGSHREYTIRLHAPELGLVQQSFGPVRLGIEPRTYFMGRFREIEGLSGSGPDLARLASWGHYHYRTLLPEHVRQRLWANRDRIRRIHVLSEEASIPWDLGRMYGIDEGDRIDDEFLCERCDVTRWFPGDKWWPRLTLRKLAVVVPGDSRLREALAELDDLRTLFDEHGREVHPVAALRSELVAALTSGEYDGWHFTGHGVDRGEDADRASILLENGERFRPEDLTGPIEDLGRARPLVFLNACQTSHGGPSLTGAGGWARRFYEAGAGAFIGARWSIPDGDARVFAREFYAQVLNGVSVGRAVRSARTAISRPGDPSRLAYTVFADPQAAVEEGPIL
jgi:CHAT domain-containing protein/tubulin-like protein